MTITPRPIKGTYGDAVFDFIEAGEGFVPRIYTDHRGIPTLGLGYALVVEHGGWNFRGGLERELDGVGIELSPDDWQLLKQARQALADRAPERAMQLIPAWSPGEDSAARNRFSFLLTREQGRALFDLIRPHYEAILARKLGPQLYDAYGGSHEMITLFSLTYNNPSLVGRGLVGALEAGSRIDAWYEIRFRSNSKRHHGLQNRRNHESDEFGLYNETTTTDEAQAVLAFLEEKQSNISAYLEQVSGSETAGRNELDRLVTIAQGAVSDASGGTALA